MKKVFFVVLILFSLLSLQIFAVELESDNYKITGFSVGSGGEEADSASLNYSLVTSIGQPINDDRFFSTNYGLGTGVANEWMANTPIVKCFETTTEGSTSCEDLDVSPDGMVMVCGQDGCYDRARIEIDPQGNPTDALYSIQIKKSTDLVWMYVDGSTFMIESASTHDINDYLLESVWEGTAGNINVIGLLPGTEYQVRMTALNGDFTESMPSPVATATTANPALSFDIDIDGVGGGLSETTGPYIVNFGTLDPDIVQTAVDRVWFDVRSNSQGGVNVYLEDLYTGLFSSSSNTTIESADNTTIDLSSVQQGFGVLEYNSSEGYVGPLSPTINYDNGGDPASTTVGGVSTTQREIYNTSGNPIYEGRGSLSLKTKIHAYMMSGSYSDQITFTLIGSF